MTETDKTGIEYYRENVRKSRAISQALGFTDPISQRASFDQFDHWALFNTDWERPLSVLDIGAGLGDLLFYMKEKGYNVTRYGYVEPVPELRDKTLERVSPIPGLKRIDSYEHLDKVESGYHADLVVCLNMLSYWTGTTTELEAYVKKLMARMNEIATKAWAINCFSHFADWYECYNKPVDTGFLIGEGKRYSERVVIDMNEAPYLQLLGVNKTESAWRKHWKPKLP